MSGLLVSLWLAVQIDGAGGCPTAADIQGQLAPLLPATAEVISADRARVVESPEALDVALARPDGRTVARRRLPRTGSCAEQAQTVAVTLAVWEAQVHPEISLRLDRLATAPVAAGQHADAEAAPTVARAAEPPAEGNRLAALGAAMFASWQPGSIVPGGRVDGTLGAAAGSWRARLSLAVVGRHTMTLSPGEAAWWRAYAAAGADYRLRIGASGQLALGVAGVLGALTAAGSGFTSDRTTRSVDLGIETMVRAELLRRSFRPWVGAALVSWLRQQTVEVTGQSATAVLPRFEVLAAVGADFCWSP